MVGTRVNRAETSTLEARQCRGLDGRGAGRHGRL
jgi:hypothetical protein